MTLDDKNLIDCQNVLSRWAERATVLDDFAEQAAADLFARLKHMVADKINAVCGSDGSLPAYDAKIYDCYMRILTTFAQIAAIHGDPAKAITTPYAKEIWDGIRAVLLSRLPAGVGTPAGPPENPISAEKTEIVTSAILSALTKLDELAMQVASDATSAAALMTNVDFDALKGFADDIITNRAACIYKIYADTATATLTKLNDLSSRQNVSRYMELLEEEQDILRQILVVQVLALENYIAEPENAMSVHETAVLHEALTLLRETHQREGAAISQINELFNAGRGAADVQAETDFNADIVSIAAFGENHDMVLEGFVGRLVGRHAAYKIAASDLLTLLVSAFHDKPVMERVYYRKKAISGLTQLVHEARGCFAAIHDYFESNKDGLAVCSGFDIIAGVGETIAIKLESLDDGVLQFMLDADELIAEFSRGRQDINAATLDAFIGHLNRGLSAVDTLDSDENIQSFPEVVQGIAEDFLAHDALAAFHDLAARALAKRESDLDKAILTFKRDSFLFELTTFEEIMYYSVSRLRENDDSAVCAFVAEIDRHHKALGGILTKYGIEKIAPTAHDPFNPKENEVLMAEENPDFKKGSIIKTMNAGYRQGDVVLVRANVIAAR